MLRCDKCGAKIARGSRFCPQCADPVTDADTAQPDATGADLICPKCKHQRNYLVTNARGTRLVCGRCKKPFTTAIVQIRAKRARGSKKDDRREFSIRFRHLDGAEDMIDFVNASYADFELRSKDLAAFTFYKGKLRIVQNLNVARYMTVSSSSCFVATFVFGDNAPEVQALRQWRDETLLASRVLCILVELYYRMSPGVVWLAKRCRPLGHVLALIVRVVAKPIIAKRARQLEPSCHKAVRKP